MEFLESFNGIFGAILVLVADSDTDTKYYVIFHVILTRRFWAETSNNKDAQLVALPQEQLLADSQGVHTSYQDILASKSQVCYAVTPIQNQ